MGNEEKIIYIEKTVDNPLEAGLKTVVELAKLNSVDTIKLAGYKPVSIGEVDEVHIDVKLGLLGDLSIRYSRRAHTAIKIGKMAFEEYREYVAEKIKEIVDIVLLILGANTDDVVVEYTEVSVKSCRKHVQDIKKVVLSSYTDVCR